MLQRLKCVAQAIAKFSGRQYLAAGMTETEPLRHSMAVAKRHLDSLETEINTVEEELDHIRLKLQVPDSLRSTLTADHALRSHPCCCSSNRAHLHAAIVTDTDTEGRRCTNGWPQMSVSLGGPRHADGGCGHCQCCIIDVGSMHS